MNYNFNILNNQEFANIIAESFQQFLVYGSHSTKKLRVLHGAIANDLATMLGDQYEIVSQGYKKGNEANIDGRYVSKAVDITIKFDGKPVAGVAVKFIMQNYSQNSVNYFENMLGETANIRSTGVPYFQIVIMCDKIPYYDQYGFIKKWESFTSHNAEKYCKLSEDNPVLYIHTPDKTLIFLVHVVENSNLQNKQQYKDFYKLNKTMTVSTQEPPQFKNGVIFNDYELFMRKIYHKVMSL